MSENLEPMLKERSVYEHFNVSRVTWHRWKKTGVADQPDLTIGGYNYYKPSTVRRMEERLATLTNARRSVSAA